MQTRRGNAQLFAESYQIREESWCISPTHVLTRYRSFGLPMIAQTLLRRGRPQDDVSRGFVWIHQLNSGIRYNLSSIPESAWPSPFRVARRNFDCAHPVLSAVLNCIDSVDSRDLFLPLPGSTRPRLR